MGRNLPFSTLTKFCSPEWVAKAYSEYLLDCAAAQTDLIAKINECALDDGLSAAYEEAFAFKDSMFEPIKRIVNEALGSEAVMYGYDLENDQFCSMMQDIWNHPDQYPEQSVILYSNYSNLIDFNETMRLYGAANGWYQAMLKFFKRSFSNYVDYVSTYNTVAVSREYLINSTCSQMHYDENSYLSFGEGSIKVYDLFKFMIDDINGVERIDAGLTLYKLNNTPNVSSLHTANDVFEEMKSAIASCSAWAIGFAASAKGAIADKISYFNSRISSIISDTSEKFANTCNVVRSQLSECKDGVTDFFNYASETLGWNAFAQDTLLTIDQTDVSQYTGASPLICIDTKTLVGRAAAVAKTLLAAGLALFNAAKKLVVAGALKAAPVVTTLTSNPIDISIDNKDDKSYTCSNFIAQTDVGNYYVMNFASDEGRDAVYDMLSSRLNKWIYIDNYFSLLQFNVNRVVKNSNHGLQIFYTMQFKPKCLNWREMARVGMVFRRTTATPDYRVCFSPIAEGALDDWEAIISSKTIYPDDSDDDFVNEGLYLMGLWLGSAATMQLGCYCVSELLDSEVWADNQFPSFLYFYAKNAEGQMENFDFTPQRINYDIGNDTSTILIPAGVTNLDFLKMSSLYEASPDRFNVLHCAADNDYSYHDERDNRRMITLDKICAGLFMCWMIQQFDKDKNPTDYLFLPYCSNTEQISGGRYVIKTDNEHSNIATILAEIIVVVVLTVLVIYITKSIVNAVQRKKFLKYTSFIGQMDNKMWSGGKLSYYEAKKYIRYKKKADKVWSSIAGLAGAGSVGSRVLTEVKDLSSNNQANMMINERVNEVDITDQVNNIVKLIKA